VTCAVIDRPFGTDYPTDRSDVKRSRAAAIRTPLSDGDRDMTTSLLLCGSVYAALGLFAAARRFLRPMRD